MSTPTAIAVLISGRGSNLNALIDYCQQSDASAKVTLVISNVENAPGLELARQNGIKTCIIKHTDYPTRESFDLALEQQLLENNTRWVLLAGFMRILSDTFVKKWQGYLINIHPSLLPLYPGLDTHARALANGDSQAGASVHFVTPQLDGGPVIIQGKVNVESNDTEKTLAARVLKVEHIIYPLALEWLLTGRATFKQNHYHLDGVIPDSPALWFQGQLQIPSTSQ